MLKYTFYLEKLCVKVGLRRSVNRKIFYLSGPDYNIWNVLSVDLELSSERVFINPPVLTEELISC